MGDNKLEITTERKNIYFDLPKDDGINLKYEAPSIIKHINFKIRLDNYCSNISMGKILMNTEKLKRINYINLFFYCHKLKLLSKKFLCYLFD